jgi:hypothetical protein
MPTSTYINDVLALVHALDDSEALQRVAGLGAAGR